MCMAGLCMLGSALVYMHSTMTKLLCLPGQCNSRGLPSHPWLPSSWQLQSALPSSGTK